MTERIVNFSAGPGILPLPVLHQAQADLVSLPGVGASALEVSHRGAWFTGVIEEAEANLRALLAHPVEPPGVVPPGRRHDAVLDGRR